MTNTSRRIRMLNIVVPMAGRGSRFVDAGYDLPKPLIDVGGIPMLRIVIENLRPTRAHRFIFICLRDHIEQYALHDTLRSWAPNCEVRVVDQVTEGAACTVLLAEEIIDSSDPLMIANSDQWVDYSIDEYLGVMDAEVTSGLIMTMTADDPKWSYLRFDEQRISAVVEKQVVSNEATVGIYNYREGRMFVEAAKTMIQRNLRVNNEFYVAPAYDIMIEKGLNLSYCNVGSEGKGMYGLGIPSDLECFLKSPMLVKARAGIL